MSLRDAWVDLVLGGSCVGCGRPGRLLCSGCDAELPDTAHAAWPSPAPAGMAAPFAAAAYDGTARALVLGLKERHLLGLAGPLGRLLALSAAEVLREAAVSGPTVLVPVPSRPGAVRARGHDSTAAITRRAARLLRRSRTPAYAVPLLRTRPGLADQAGLDRAGRAANLAGSLTCPAQGVRRLAARRPTARAIVCDDVITTGATAREAQRALEAVGVPVIGIAAVAATPRRHR